MNKELATKTKLEVQLNIGKLTYKEQAKFIELLRKTELSIFQLPDYGTNNISIQR